MQVDPALDGERIHDFGEPFPEAAVGLTGTGPVGDDPAAHIFYAEDAVSKNVGYAGAPGQAAHIAAQRLPKARRGRVVQRRSCAGYSASRRRAALPRWRAGSRYIRGEPAKA